jgi:hypothetical protein
MTDRWSRLAPLTGIVFAVLTVIAVFAGGETPNTDAGPAKVIAYYTTHASEIETSSILVALGFLALVLFGGALRSYLRRTPAAEGLGSLVLAGAVLMAVGVFSTAGIEYGLAHELRHFGPQVAQTLNVLANELFLPILAGGFLFGVCAGIAILRGAALPKWLGWIAIVLGIVTLIPPIGFFALFGFVIWVVIVSILMYLRLGPPPDAGAEAQPVVQQQPVA